MESVYLCVRRIKPINIIFLFFYCICLSLLYYICARFRRLRNSLSVHKKQCVTTRTNQLMHVDYIIYHKKHRHVNIGLFHLKGQCHEIFDFSFFMYQFPPSPGPEYLFWDVSIFLKILRHFLSLMCTTSVVDTWHQWCALTCEFPHEFWKEFEMTIMLFSGALGKMIHEKT